MGESKRKEKARREKSPAEIERHFFEQWNMLVSSCLAFDAGDSWEVARIANSVSMFCSDRGQFSLFTLTDFVRTHGGTAFDTAGHINCLNLLNDHPLVGMELGANGARFTNWFDDAFENRWSKIGDWWGKHPVVRFAKDDRRLTRSDLVLIVRDKQGGSHVDKDFHEILSRIEEDLDQGWMAESNGIEQTMNGSILVCSIRQIGHEVVRTIEMHGASLVKDGKKYPTKLGLKEVKI
jgi:hypothetical protein